MVMYFIQKCGNGEISALHIMIVNLKCNEFNK